MAEGEVEEEVEVEVNSEAKRDDGANCEEVKQIKDK